MALRQPSGGAPRTDSARGGTWLGSTSGSAVRGRSFCWLSSRGKPAWRRGDQASAALEAYQRGALRRRRADLARSALPGGGHRRGRSAAGAEPAHARQPLHPHRSLRRGAPAARALARHRRAERRQDPGRRPRAGPRGDRRHPPGGGRARPRHHLLRARARGPPGRRGARRRGARRDARAPGLLLRRQGLERERAAALRARRRDPLARAGRLRRVAAGEPARRRRHPARPRQLPAGRALLPARAAHPRRRGPPRSVHLHGAHQLRQPASHHGASGRGARGARARARDARGAARRRTACRSPRR